MTHLLGKIKNTYQHQPFSPHRCWGWSIIFPLKRKIVIKFVHVNYVTTCNGNGCSQDIFVEVVDSGHNTNFKRSHTQLIFISSALSQGFQARYLLSEQDLSSGYPWIFAPERGRHSSSFRFPFRSHCTSPNFIQANLLGARNADRECQEINKQQRAREKRPMYRPTRSTRALRALPTCLSFVFRLGTCTHTGGYGPFPSDERFLGCSNVN